MRTGSKRRSFRFHFPVAADPESELDRGTGDGMAGKVLNPENEMAEPSQSEDQSPRSAGYRDPSLGHIAEKWMVSPSEGEPLRIQAQAFQGFQKPSGKPEDAIPYGNRRRRIRKIGAGRKNRREDKGSLGNGVPCCVEEPPFRGIRRKRFRGREEGRRSSFPCPVQETFLSGGFCDPDRRSIQVHRFSRTGKENNLQSNEGSQKKQPEEKLLGEVSHSGVSLREKGGNTLLLSHFIHRRRRRFGPPGSDRNSPLPRNPNLLDNRDGLQK